LFSIYSITDNGFQAIAGFPGVLGCIDGTLIRIKRPKENENEYVGRKEGHRVNIQAVALPDGSFSNVVARYPGSAHDSRVFRESSLHMDLVAGRKEGLLIGDSAYALSPFLMKPLTNPRTQPERNYQESLLATRATVERNFGQLKGRFNCLHQKLRYSPQRACTIIAACFALQNFAIRRNLPAFNFNGEHFAEGGGRVVLDDPNNNVVIDGKIAQARLIRNYFA
jgi:nuclease HARBI1